MKSILIFLLVSILGSLAAKAARTSDSSVASHDVTKREVSVRWRKLNFSPVCFGAKNNQFGRFYVTRRFAGKLAAVKLVHLYGYVTCDTRHVSYWSYWGCGSYSWGLGKLNVVITTSGNHVLLPPREFIVHNGAKWSKVPGYNSLSPELVMSFFHPYSVHWGQELRLWYGEDLMNAGQGDNGGNSCIDVYALFV